MLVDTNPALLIWSSLVGTLSMVPGLLAMRLICTSLKVKFIRSTGNMLMYAMQPIRSLQKALLLHPDLLMFMHTEIQGRPPDFENFLAMGVTTIMLGQDGASPWVREFEARPAR